MVISQCFAIILNTCVAFSVNSGSLSDTTSGSSAVFSRSPTSSVSLFRSQDDYYNLDFEKAAVLGGLADGSSIAYWAHCSELSGKKACQYTVATSPTAQPVVITINYAGEDERDALASKTFVMLSGGGVGPALSQMTTLQASHRAPKARPVKH